MMKFKYDWTKADSSEVSRLDESQNEKSFPTREFRATRGSNRRGRGRYTRGRGSFRGSICDYCGTGLYEGNKKNITLPTPLIAIIIGVGGRTVRKLERECNAKISVGMASGDSTLVTLTGCEEDLDRLENLIKKIIEDKTECPAQNTCDDEANYIPGAESFMKNENGVEDQKMKKEKTIDLSSTNYERYMKIRKQGGRVGCARRDSW